MDCHSKERAEETGATLVAKSHYLDREDKKHPNISPRPPQRSPRIYFNPPTFNHLPPDGLIITTGAGTTELTTKKRSLSPYGVKRG